MKALNSLNILQDLCASQKGMFTAAQALGLGVGKMDLFRLSENGHVERMARGVYRASAAPPFREEDVYAAWLALDPAVAAFSRPVDGSGFTASLNTAAWLQGLGELNASPMTFSCPRRRQTRSTRLRFLKRALPAGDVVLVAGVPTTSPRRTVLDLIDHGEDLSLVSAVLRDAEESAGCEGLANEINLRAAACGYAEGFDLYGRMKGR